MITIMRNAILLISIIISMLRVSVVFAEPVYAKSASLPPIRVTYSDLEAVLTKASTFIIAANASGTGAFRETMNVQEGESSVEISGHSFKGANVQLLKIANQFRYGAHWKWSDPWIDSNAPISNVTLDFSDFSRTVKVEGSSPEQVDALFALLKNDLIGLSAQLGGRSFRSTSGLVVFFLSFYSSIMFAVYLFRTKRLRLLWPLLFSLVTLILLIAIPFDRILAGFSLSELDPSFVVRYASEISLFGVLVSLVAIPLSYFLPKRSTPEGK